MIEVNPVKAKAKFVSKRKLTDHVYELRFKMVSPLELNFLPGQYIAIVIDPKTRRQYSISSSPLKSNTEFELLIDIRPDGVGTNYLMNLKEDDEMEFIGQIGHFTLPLNLKQNLIFVGTGTGIAPLKSMIETLILEQQKKDIYVIFGTRHKNQIFYKDLFNEYLMKNQIKDFKICLSQDELPGCINGRVTELLKIYDTDLIKNAQVFLCGGGDMIKTMETDLIKLGKNSNDIIYEKFY